MLGSIWIDYEMETHKNCSRVVNSSHRVIKIFLSEKAIGSNKVKVPTHRQANRSKLLPTVKLFLLPWAVFLYQCLSVHCFVAMSLVSLCPDGVPLNGQPWPLIPFLIHTATVPSVQALPLASHHLISEILTRQLLHLILVRLTSNRSSHMEIGKSENKYVSTFLF